MAVVLNVEFTENGAKGEEISDEDEGAKDRALGHTCSDWGGVGFKGFELDELCVCPERQARNH